MNYIEIKIKKLYLLFIILIKQFRFDVYYCEDGEQHV